MATRKGSMKELAILNVTTKKLQIFEIQLHFFLTKESSSVSQMRSIILLVERCMGINLELS